MALFLVLVPYLNSFFRLFFNWIVINWWCYVSFRHIGQRCSHIFQLSSGSFCVLSHFRCFQFQLFVTLWTIACQSPLSMEFSRQEHWSGLSSPPSGGSSQPRDWTWVSCISCIGRWILYCWTAWEALLTRSVGQSQDVSLSHFPVMFPGVTSPVNRASKSLSQLLGKPQARDACVTCLLLAVKGESALRIISTG